MTATLSTAVDDIMAFFKTVWDTTGFDVQWPDVADKGNPPTTQNPWARVKIIHVTAAQLVLSDGSSGKRFNRTGNFIVQVFVPVGKGATQAYSLAQTVIDGFQGKATTNAVWFRNVRANEIGVSGDWFQINVVMDFEYDQFVPPSGP